MRHPILMPSTKLSILFILFSILTWLVVGVDGASQLKITVTPRICSEPCKFSVGIQIGPDIKEGDTVCIGLFDELPRGSSCYPHPGFKSTSTIISNIPAGLYEVRVAIQGASQIHRASAQLIVRE